MDKRDMTKHSAWNKKWKIPNEDVKYEYGMWSHMLLGLRFWGTEIYTPSVFRIYADIQGWRTN